MKEIYDLIKPQDEFLEISFPQGNVVIFYGNQWYDSQMVGTGNLTRGFFPVGNDILSRIKPNPNSAVICKGLETFIFELIKKVPNPQYDGGYWHCKYAFQRKQIAKICWNWDKKVWEA